MKLPRDLSGLDLARGLARVGYTITRQTGSHIRLTLPDEPQHHITIPAHQPLKVGTLAAILSDVGTRLHLGRDALLGQLKL
ncbi:type II toxin-antitoxin system HicA family toxin [Sphaerotilus sp.]|uniref:type II toxin-antitoxin system HicA family toxin n=1 Tax=Sphaerotilus sp. TaxID=2093942 RepID=UPI002ACE54EE|nr:type II toxin-antitoxin system HicA family toxin [Sphaerotilus sp.]MDZ7857045.1 type II toxin-antitoxin system HicA family toxin [Sphaerotilus sp.]